VLLRKIRAVLALAGKKRKGVFYAPQKLLLRKTFVVRDQKSLLGQVCLIHSARRTNFPKSFFQKHFWEPYIFCCARSILFKLFSLHPLPET
ncbi:MAG: hypothetical protein IKO42_05925, partial [Opitutales bacterium]|nr:hypothetical protein [Opitutales bacterium]